MSLYEAQALCDAARCIFVLLSRFLHPLFRVPWVAGFALCVCAGQASVGEAPFV